MSAPILLDPRVHRVFVTSLSDQSVPGTKQLNQEISRRILKNPGNPSGAVISTQFQATEHITRVEELTDVLAGAMRANLNQEYLGEENDLEVPDERTDSLAIDQGLRVNLSDSPFNSQLLALPAKWNDVVDLVELFRPRCWDECYPGERRESLGGVRSPAPSYFHPRWIRRSLPEFQY